MLLSLYGVGDPSLYFFLLLFTLFFICDMIQWCYWVCVVLETRIWYFFFLLLYFLSLSLSLNMVQSSDVIQFVWCWSLFLSFTFNLFLYILVFSGMIHWHWNFLIASAKSWQEEHKSFTERRPNKVNVFISDFLCNLPFLLLVLWWYLSAC